MVQRFCTAYEHSKCVPSRMPRRIAVDKKATPSPARMVIDTLASGTLRTRARPREALKGLPEPYRLLTSSRAPVEAPTGKVVWGSHIIAGALGRDRSAASGATPPRAGAAERARGAAEGQRAAIAAPLGFATASRIDAARRRQHKAKGQPTAHTQDPHDTLRANKAARTQRTRWPAATRRRAAAASGNEKASATPST